MQDHFTEEASIRRVKAQPEPVQNLSTTTNTKSQGYYQEAPEEIPFNAKYEPDAVPLELGLGHQSVEDHVSEYNGIAAEDHQEGGELPLLDLGVQGEDEIKDQDGAASNIILIRFNTIAITDATDAYEDGLHQDKGQDVSSYLGSDSMYSTPYSIQKTDEFSMKSEEEEVKELSGAKKEECDIHNGVLNFSTKKEEYYDTKSEPCYNPYDLNLVINHHQPQGEQNCQQFMPQAFPIIPSQYIHVNLCQTLQLNVCLLHSHLVLASQPLHQSINSSLANSVFQKNILNKFANYHSSPKQNKSPLIRSTASSGPLSVTELKKRSKARHDVEKESIVSEEKYSNQKKKAKTGSPRIDSRKRSSIEKNYIELAFCGFARCLRNEIEGRPCNELERAVKNFIYEHILGRENETQRKKIASKQEIHAELLRIVDGDKERDVKEYLLNRLREFFQEPSPDRPPNSVNWANWLLFHCTSPIKQKLWFAKNVKEIEQSLAYHKNINRFNFKFSEILEKKDEECKEDLRKHFSESSWALTNIMNFFNKK